MSIISISCLILDFVSIVALNHVDTEDTFQQLIHIYFRSCVGFSSCSWCRVNSKGNKLDTEYCTSSKKCYWGISGDHIEELGPGGIVAIIAPVLIVIILITVCIYKCRHSASKAQRGGPPSQPAQPTPQTSGQAFAVQDGGYSNPAMTSSNPSPQAMYSPLGYLNPPPTAPEAPPAYEDMFNTYPANH